MSNCKIAFKNAQVVVSTYNDRFLFLWDHQLQGSSLETFFIIGKVSSEAVIEAKMSQSKSLVTWFNIKLDKILLELRLWGMQMALWLLQVRKVLSWSNQTS